MADGQVLTSDGSTVFELDYLCVDAQGSKISTDRLLRTPNTAPAYLAECLRLAQLWPPPPAQRTEAMPGALGLFRGESVDYFLVKAQQGTSGAPHFQFVLMPAAPLRQLAGNWRWFEPFGREPIPESDVPRANLPQFVIDHPEPASVETQVEDLLTLFSYCSNRAPVVRGLVAALVQRMGIGIINAPPSLHDRLTFVQGLLTLLPAPLRAGITFATSVLDPARTNAQIKFLTSDARPARHLIFDWTAGKLLTETPADTYSQFIVSQFRLDPALAVEQMRQLERTAAWRMSRKDDLAGALAWASRRQALDLALMNNQPGDPTMVAEVLAEDPSLTNELRLVYTHHLLNLALSLNEPERADAVGTACARFAYVADTVATELQPAAADPDRAATVETILVRWMSSLPNFDLGDSRWVALLSNAILTSAKPTLDSGDPAAIKALLESYLTLPSSLRLERVMAQLIGGARRLATTDPNVARATFLLAATFLPSSGLQRLLNDSALVSQLTESLRATLALIVSPSSPGVPPIPIAPGLLAQAAASYGPVYQPIIMTRLIELALQAGRIDAVDAEALKALVSIGGSVRSARFDVLCQEIVQGLSRLNVLRTLDVRSTQYLVMLNLVRGRTAEAITQVTFYQDTLYKGANTDELSQLVQRVFQETPLPASQLAAAFEVMQSSDLRAIVRAHAYLGALLAHNWSSDMDFAIKDLTTLLASDGSLIPTLGMPHALRLAQANADRRDAVNTLRLASVVAENALLLGEWGGALIEQLYRLVNWGPEMAASALEMLRAYVRRAPFQVARAVAERMGRQYGPAMSKALDATVRLRIILSSADLVAFADQLEAAAQLLTDLAASYHGSQEIPNIHRLRQMVEGIPGGLSDAERERLANNFFRLAEQLLVLARLRTREESRPNVTGLLIQGGTAPGSGVDALRWLGGHFAAHRAFPMSLDRTVPPLLFGNRSTNALLRDTDTLITLLDHLLGAFGENTLSPDNAAFRAEVESLWSQLPAYVQRQIQGKLAENAQIVASLIGVVGDAGNERILANSGYGKQLVMGRVQPRSAIEALRWVNGYFSGQHTG